MKLKTTKLVTLKLPRYYCVYLTLVGCGGTGSHLASGLATLALALREQDHPVRIMFVDPDHVEEKNVGRQLFTTAEVGLAKSGVLAMRLAQAYALPIDALIRPVSAEDICVGTREDLSLVIGAVDNAAARQVIAQACERAAGQLWWLDCGNENHSGQIALGNSVEPRRWKPALGMVDALPAPHVVYPDLVKAPKAAKHVSCADALEQGLMVNRMVAAWALAMLHDFLLGQLKYFTLDFDLAFGGVRARPLDEAALAEVA
jgi:PRTRC genetic system ThiF family protein